MAEKILNTRIQLKIDTLENWKNSTLKIKNGEVCFATVAAEAGTGLEEPVVMMKVGTSEEKTFSELPWAFYAKSSDVLAACKTEAGLTAFVNKVIGDAGIATDEAMQALAERVDAAEDDIDALQSDLNTAETGLKAKMAAAEAKIEAIEGKFGKDNVALEIEAAINALNLATTYEAKGEAAKVQTALNEYKNANDAKILEHTNAISANTNAIAAIKDGAAMDSFADVEAALAGKEEAGAAAQALTDAKAYADGLAGNYDAKGSAATAESNAKAYAKEYADGLAKDYDAAGAAAQALTDAKAYTDGFTGGKTVAESINTVIANYSTTEQMNTAIATAKGEAVAHANGLNTAMDERVQALEAIDHSHTFDEAELNKIESGDVAKWNAAEQNAKTYAKDYADGLNTAMDSRVDALEAKFTGTDSVAKQIEDAVAAEAELRAAADLALQNQIGAASEEGKAATGLHARIEELESLVGDDKVSEAIDAAVKAEADRAKGIEAGLENRLKAVEDTYATDDDVAGLQNQINLIMNNPDTKDVIDSIAEFTQYVADHGTIAEGMRTDINKNATDLAAEVKRAGDAEAELQGAINGVAADLETLEGEVAKKALQSDLTALDGRVTTAEGKITTLEGEMDAAEGRLDALEGLVGDKKVSEAIDEAVAACKADASNKDAVVLAEITAHAGNGDIHVTAADKTTWNAAVQTVTAAANSGLKAVKTGTDVAIEINEDLVWVFDCGGAV